MTLTIEEIKSLPEDMQSQYASWGAYTTHPDGTIQKYITIERINDDTPPHFVLTTWNES